MQQKTHKSCDPKNIAWPLKHTVKTQARSRNRGTRCRDLEKALTLKKGVVPVLRPCTPQGTRGNTLQRLLYTIWIPPGYFAGYTGTRRRDQGSTCGEFAKHCRNPEKFAKTAEICRDDPSLCSKDPLKQPAANSGIA